MALRQEMRADEDGRADAASLPVGGDGAAGGASVPLGRIGRLEVRLARDAAEVEAAQELRHRIFFAASKRSSADGGGAHRRDADRFDAICDHLLVLDMGAQGQAAPIVGTYRLLRQERASEGFYSQDEFDFQALVTRHPGRRFLELGRSCVLPAYRGKRTVELLWQGIWAYCRRHGIDVMAGCASFAGTVPAAHAEALSFLHHCHRAEADWAVWAQPERYRSMDLMPAEALHARKALAGLPPLVKGYLRLGARFGQGCVVDAAFSTTDVFVVLPVERIARRYIDHYGPDAERFSAARA